jgi:hypothetical protein
MGHGVGVGCGVGLGCTIGAGCAAAAWPTTPVAVTNPTPVKATAVSTPARRIPPTSIEDLTVSSLLGGGA